jgi:hypothetical protein
MDRQLPSSSSVCDTMRWWHTRQLYNLPDYPTPLWWCLRWPQRLLHNDNHRRISLSRCFTWRRLFYWLSSRIRNFIDIAVKLGSKGVDFLPGEKASRSTDNICGQVCATAATSGSGVAIVCNVCTCSFYSSECITIGECISQYVCQ